MTKTNVAKKRLLLRDSIRDMDVAKELIANRYLLNVILTNLFRIQNTMNTNIDILKREKKNESKEKVTQKEKKDKRKEKKGLRSLSNINFEKFSITSDQHEALTREYGIDVVNEACILLDGWLKAKNKDVKDSYHKLKSWAIHQVMKKRLSDLASDIVIASTEVDYTLIEDELRAKKYINSVPSHIRNVDLGVKYLVAKFNFGKGVS